MANNADTAMIRALRKSANRQNDEEPAYKRDYNRGTVLWLVFVLIATLALRAYVFQNTRVEGDSMYPNFFTDEQVFVEKLTFLVNEPKRGEVIICRYSDFSKPVIKRVIGLPGETVEIRSGKTYINGEELDESAYWNDYIYGDMDPVTVPENTVFVMGDNRNVSLDSRMEGPVPYYRIIGRAVFVMWPLSSFGRIAD
ncbi:MAG: signal peptidase I [Christensenellales bacterium]|jgi:signal peptidase I